MEPTNLVPVRRGEISKSNGGTRLLSIPTVTDRFIQQAIAQVLTPLFDPTFSEHSYGFRPNKRRMWGWVYIMAGDIWAQLHLFLCIFLI